MNEFVEDLFVGRETQLNDLAKWIIEDTGRRRLMSIVAPPGYGKTWLLHYLGKHLSNISDLFVIFLSATEIRSRQHIFEKLQPLIKAVQETCHASQAIEHSDDADEALPQLIPHLLTLLCKECIPPRIPILIVDGFDEVSGSERKEIEKQVFETFLQVRQTKIVTSFRDPISLTRGMLRKSEQRILLRPFTEDEGRQQIDKLVQLHPAMSSIFQNDFLNRLSPYSFYIPGLNKTIFDHFKQKKEAQEPPILSAQDLIYCRQRLISDDITTIYPVDLNALNQDLQRIVREQADSWTLEMFAQTLNYSQAEALRQLQWLKAFSLVSQHEKQKQRYLVTKGIREIIEVEIRLSIQDHQTVFC